jgi:histidyl-tRNA synthetase
VLILGDDELAAGQVTVKNMKTGEQSRVARADAVAHCRQA